jgi:hypothetical protein
MAPIYIPGSDSEDNCDNSDNGGPGSRECVQDVQRGLTNVFSGMAPIYVPGSDSEDNRDGSKKDASGSESHELLDNEKATPDASKSLKTGE